MTETAVEEKANGIPVPEEGTEEFARMNKMATVSYTHLTLPTNREV